MKKSKVSIPVNNVMAVTDAPYWLTIIKPTPTNRRIAMMSIGYQADDIIDGANFFGAELDDYELPSVEDFSDNFDNTVCSEEITDVDGKDGFLMEDIMNGYEIYNMA